QEEVLFDRVQYGLQRNAFYRVDINAVAILAPHLYPEFTNKSTLNKHYLLFFTLGHEIFHSVVRKYWAERSGTFESGMHCLYEHFSQTCDLYGVGACNSGSLTFQEDGSDVEGLRIAHELLMHNYKPEELRKIVFTSKTNTVDRE
ncbi:hypothetical protein PMAYCL1PPCAC_33164, partial [Pristionchus mayeri]